MLNQNCRIQVFYDRTCGLCHKFVLFILRNMEEKVFIFSPQSEHSFKSIKGSEKYLGKTIIVYLVAEKKLLSKGAAIQLILLHLTQPWRLASYFLRCIPTPILDYVYDFVAKIRHDIFKKPNDACPIVPSKWSIYFKDDNV